MPQFTIEEAIAVWVTFVLRTFLDATDLAFKPALEAKNLVFVLPFPIHTTKGSSNLTITVNRAEDIVLILACTVSKLKQFGMA